jgi:hypothetical protein
MTPIGRVRAQITYSLGGWERIFSPAAWVSEFLSSVDIGPGDTRNLIVAIQGTNVEGAVFWTGVINRRGQSGDAISIERPDISPFRNGTILVELVSCESGRILAACELTWVWRLDDGTPGGVVGIKQLQP